MGTPKQQRLLKLILENYGNGSTTRPLGELLREAGYSDNSSDNPKDILEGEFFKENETLQDFIKALDDKRRMAITHLTEKKLEGANPRTLATVIDVLTKNHQLLSGKETEKTGVTIKVVNYGNNPTA